jgi:NADH-quinone oxidoreductase subunit N
MAGPYGGGLDRRRQRRRERLALGFTLPTSEWFGVTSPLVVLFVGAAVVLVVGTQRFVEKRPFIPAILGVLFVLGSFGIIFLLKPYIYAQQLPMDRMFVYDGYARYVQIIMLLLTLAGCLAAAAAAGGRGGALSREVGLLLILCMALTLAAATADLFVMFLSGETAVLVYGGCVAAGGSGRTDPGRTLAFLRTGLVGSMCMLLGTAFLFGVGGTNSLFEISGKLYPYFFGGPGTATAAARAAATVALLLLLLGLLAKTEAFPFHGWLAGGSRIYRTPLGAFLSTGLKIAAFGAFMRVLWVFFCEQPGTGASLPLLDAAIALAAVLSLAAGSWKACRTRDVKLLLAYGGVVHTGLMLLALTALDRKGIESVLLYLVACALASAGLFLVLAAVERATGKTDLASFEGLFRRAPAAAVSAAALLASQIGLPPTAGFMARYVLLKTLFYELPWWSKVLAGLGVAACAVSVFYYGRVIVLMFFRKPAGTADEAAKDGTYGRALQVMAFVFALAVLLASFAWKPMLRAVVSAMMIIEYQY